MIRSVLKKLFWAGFHKLLSDRQYIKTRYWLEHGFFPDLDEPARLSEKIHYLKLHDRSELRKMAADRFRVRTYVADTIGGQYLIPVISVFSRLTEDVWQSLPGSFVLKASHGSGMAAIINHKPEEEYEKIRHLTDKWISHDYSRFGREWIYEGMERKIIAEKLITPSDGGELRDYKFFCFHGEVSFFHVDIDRFTAGKRNFYNRNLEPIEGRFRLPNSSESISLPSEISRAIEIAEKLSAGFNFIRVDLYIADGRIYFGELTNFPGNGFNRLEPGEFDLKAGSYLSLEKPG